MALHKARCAKWTGALTDMGFSKEQSDSALLECKSLRQAVEWLCSGPKADPEVLGADSSPSQYCPKAPGLLPGTAPSAAVCGQSSSLPKTAAGDSSSSSSLKQPMSPMWVAMSQCFNQNVSALKSRQCRKSLQGWPSSRRPSGAKRGPSPSLSDSRVLKRPGSVSATRDRPGARLSASRSRSAPGRQSSSARRSSSPPASTLRPVCSPTESSQELPQPLPTPVKKKRSADELKCGEGGRRGSVTRRESQQTVDKVLESALDNENCVREAVANAPTPDAPSCACSDFKSRRLRSKTPEPVESHCRGRRKRKRSKSPSVCPSTPQESAGSAGLRRRSRTARSPSPPRHVKSYRVKWAWKLSDMGFSDKQIEAALQECSTQRHAIEWLCSER